MDIAIEACMYDNCNNPLEYRSEELIGEKNPLSILDSNERQTLVAYLAGGGFGNRPAQIFMNLVEADRLGHNPWNFEPNWYRAIQELRPQDLHDAKMQFLREIANSYETYLAFEEYGIDLVGGE
ncbi:MAG: hypothetical protein R6U51_06550 [Anaerolineales bacterium]